MADYDDEECVCAKCHEDYSLRENSEPSKYCDACAHGVVAELEAQLTQAQAEIAALEKRLRWYRAAHLLVSNEFAFVGHRDGEDARLMMLDNDQNWNPTLCVLCSDTFAYACADAESAEYFDAEALLQIAQQDGWVGLMRWVQERRKAQGEAREPIKPVATMFASHDAMKAEIAALRGVVEAAEYLRSEASNYKRDSMGSKNTTVIDAIEDFDAARAKLKEAT